MDLENHEIRQHDFVICVMPWYNKNVQSYLRSVKVVLMRYGNGATKLVIVGGFQTIFGRSSPPFLTLMSAWDRIMLIASIQARTWNYTGPYGFGDMDMLGTLSFV